MRHRRKRGQAVILVLVAMSLLLIGGIGLAIDSSTLYSHRQMAQAAADSAAQAAIMSIFNETNTGTNAFGSIPFTCTVGTDVRTPCVYARYNGFGVNGDTVDVDFPPSAPGVDLSDEDPIAVVRVIISRDVETGLTRFLGASSVQRIRATGIAAIAKVASPVPILVLHPTLSGSYAINGTPIIRICGGPSRSIQVNSESKTSIVTKGGSNLVDLSKAGPKDDGNCNTGTGADFGDYGGPSSYPGGYNWGSGQYVQPASPITDPLLGVPAPAVPVNDDPPKEDVPGGSGGCPLPVGQFCKLYSPGNYTSGIEVKNEFALLKPGLYYMSGGGFKIRSNGVVHMAPCVDPSEPVFGCGVMVYNAGSNVNDIFDIESNAGQFGGVVYSQTVSGGTVCFGNCFVGSRQTGLYKGILFFQARNRYPRNHHLQGGGGLVLKGTIYMTATEATMRLNPADYQWLELRGNPGSTTKVIGMIMVDKLELGGTADIYMTLDPTASLKIRQVALVR